MFLDASQNEVKKQVLKEEKRVVTAGMPQLQNMGLQASYQWVWLLKSLSELSTLLLIEVIH